MICFSASLPKGRRTADRTANRAEGRRGNPDLHVRSGGRAPLHREVVQGQARVLQVHSQRASQHQGLPLRSDRRERKKNSMFLRNPKLLQVSTPRKVSGVILATRTTCRHINLAASAVSRRLDRKRLSNFSSIHSFVSIHGTLKFVFVVNPELIGNQFNKANFK